MTIITIVSFIITVNSYWSSYRQSKYSCLAMKENQYKLQVSLQELCQAHTYRCCVLWN
jgi:hypothetical protein